MQLKDSYILAKNQEIKTIKKVLLLIVTVMPFNSLLYLTNYIVLEPLIKGKPIFQLLIKGINRHIFQILN